MRRFAGIVAAAVDRVRRQCVCAGADRFHQGRDQDHRPRQQDLAARRSRAATSPSRSARTALIVVDSQFAPLYDKIKAAITAISPLPVKYVIATHYHGDHTGGIERFQNDGAIGVAQDNIRVRLAAGTINGITGNKTPPRRRGRHSEADLYRRHDHGRDRRTQGVADPRQQRTHRRRHVHLLRRRQRARDRRSDEQQQALSGDRLRQWRRHPRRDQGDGRDAARSPTPTPRSSPVTARRRRAPTSPNTGRCWRSRMSAWRSCSTKARARKRCWPRGR